MAVDADPLRDLQRRLTVRPSAVRITDLLAPALVIFQVADTAESGPE